MGISRHSLKATPPHIKPRKNCLANTRCSKSQSTTHRRKIEHRFNNKTVKARSSSLPRKKVSRSPQLISFDSKRLVANIEVRYKATPNSLRRPLSGLSGLGRLSPETVPGSFDVSLGSPVAPGPCLGSGRGVFRDI